MKCISYHRVGDGQSDCDYSEDELVDTCQFNDSNRYRCQQNSNVCLKQVTIGDGFRNCPSNEDEAFTYAEKMETLVSFPDICNQYWNTDLNLFPVNETDETNCHWWPCDNPYTHCNEIFNCLNGIDELNCPNRNCDFNEHQCQIKDSKIFYCLPIDQIYEKYLDQTNETYPLRQIYFHNKTIDINNQYFPWNNNQCITADRITKIDQKLLTKQNKCLYPQESIFLMYLTAIKSFSNDEDLCEFKFSSPHFSNQMVYFFKTSRLGYFPSLSINQSIPLITKTDQKDPIIDFIDPTLISYCHRGIPVFTGRNETIKCFCPPNYFGSQCQWQNQRINLTLQFVCRDTTSICIICQVVIMLIDEEGKISPYSEQITYVPTRDCNTKFNIYLLYPQRLKSISSKYFIRIDLFEKSELNYWTSWFISIPFQFLPVNRISTQLIIPTENEECSLPCEEHGQCRYYTNNRSLFFCQCHQGFSGFQCQIKEQCYCGNDSFCLTSSICICPLYKFGRYCYLTHLICYSSNNPCQHNGLCIPTDDRIDLNGFRCFCSDDYSGERCENENNRIEIKFDQTIFSNTSLLFLHFITAFDNAEHERITIFKKGFHLITIV